MGDIVVVIFGKYNLSDAYLNQCKYLYKYLTTANLVDSAGKMLPNKISQCMKALHPHQSE